MRSNWRELGAIILGFGFLCILPDNLIPASTRALYLQPPPNIERFSLGYRSVVADALWLRVIQNYDLCEAPRTEKVAQSSDQTSRCHLGWVFHMLDSITDLDPRFKIPFTTGATVLSIAVDDREGARRMFEKGILKFPNDWPLIYQAAYHYLYEVGDRTRAAELFVQAGQQGAPQWVFSLAARIYSQEGKAEAGKFVLVEYLKDHPEGAGAERAKLRLAEIEKTLASVRLPSGD